MGVAHPLVVKPTVTVASVFAAVSGRLPETSCKKKTVPLFTHLPVADVPFGPVWAKSAPVGEPTCTSTTEVAVEVHERVVIPSPLPSHT